ncbi:MAG: DegV family EDD domain-containing protein [Lachnospiraceae bacterium]|nr:DegV family EDD domain-containing protein [Lachnospiraceae bacterium]
MMRIFNKSSEEALIRTYRSSILSSCVALFCVAALEIIMLGASALNPGLYGDYLVIYRCLYLMLFAVSLACAFLCLYVRRDFPNRYRMLGVGYPVAAVIFFLWILAISYYDTKVNGVADPIAYMTFSLAVPLCFYMPAPLYTVISVAADAMMAQILFLAPASAASMPNMIVFFFFQLVLGIGFLRIKKDLTEQIIASEAKTAEVEEISRAQSHFFSNMSHEIRTPINTIIGLNEMILRENASDEINEDAENIQAASRMLLHLINDILDMSKIESGQMQLNEAPYHPGDMLSDIVGMLWLRAREKDLEFHIDISPEIPAVLYGDEVRIKQILINVLNNAIKYTQEGSVKLSVHCKRDDAGGAVITYAVKDTGIGIKKENLPYLFTAFKRVDEEKNKHIEGTGLGLSIVKQMVNMMNGTISVNSVYTKGSTFLIEIPQKIVNNSYIGEIDLERRRREKKEHIYVESFEAPEARVLAVDDTAANLMVVQKLLKATRVQLDIASSGEEALKKTLAESYHVVLMDHKMPEMDGVECMHAMRKQTGGRCHDAKIIALTANAGSDMEAKYINEGFDGYLLKPVTGDELESTLFRFLPRDLVTVTGSAEKLAEESTAWLDDHRKKVSVRITTESVADLPGELIAKHNIAVLPHTVQTEHGLFKDGLEIDTRGLLPLMESGSEVVLTKAPSQEDHERFFSRQLDEANNIVHISISSKLAESGCIIAERAADCFENVSVVDTGHLSSGQGLMAIEAARLAEEGLPPEEITKELDKMKSHVYTSFIVDSMDFLARQKQVSERIARLADALMVHPVLALKKGRMGVSRIYFGSRERAWERYIASVFRVPGVIDKRMLFITYVGMTVREIEEVRAMAEKYVRFDKVYYQKASPAIAANCGPGTFGLLFFTRY